MIYCRKFYFLEYKMNKIMRKALAALLCGAVFTSCAVKKSAAKSIAVFAPGILADSATYRMLADGVQAAVDTYNTAKADAKKVKLDIIEAGTNQAEWSTKLTAVAATQTYDLIVTSNPSMPDLAEPLTAQFPAQKFLILDAAKSGNKNIATVRYNQHEQSYLAGYIAGLMSKTGKLGLIAGQEYPVMNNVILPGFEEGAQAAFNGASVDFRIVGNWYSASKGGELADAMAKSSVDVILPICGGAAQGVIASAVANHFYLVWFDSNGFSRAPKNVIGSAITNQHSMAEEMTRRFLEDKIEWGTAETVGIKEGFVDFVQDDPIYMQNIPEDVRQKMAALIERIKTGALTLPQEL